MFKKLFGKKRLYLAESREKARIIAKQLGITSERQGAFVDNRSVVTWCFGHMLELAMPDAYIGSGKWNFHDLRVAPGTPYTRSDWMMKVKVSANEQMQHIAAWMKGADEVIIATDPDDEGEVIGRDVIMATGYKGPVSRMWLSALSPDKLAEAIKHPLPLTATNSLFAAGQARRLMDWLIGMNLTRAFTLALNLGRTVHVGRVQSALLKLIVDHEKTLANFKLQTYFDVLATLETPSGLITARLVPNEPNDIFNHEQALAISDASLQDAELISVSSSASSFAPPLPYDLADLMIDATELGWSAQTIMEAAQALYMAGALSYPRTSSNELPGKGNESFANHSALMTLTATPPACSSAAMLAVFDLIQERNRLQDAGHFVTEDSRFTFRLGSETFVYDARKVIEPSWQAQASRIQWDKQYGRLTPHLQKRNQVKVARLEVQERTTEASAPLNDGSLIALMKELGLGTAATRAKAIEDLHSKGMLTRVGNNGFMVTLHGQQLTMKLPPEVTDLAVTLMRNDLLEQVRSGELDVYECVMQTADWVNAMIGVAEQMANLDSVAIRKGCEFAY